MTRPARILLPTLAGTAVVLGGVSLNGGRGGLLGPIVAVFILRTVRLDLTLLSVDPNVTRVQDFLRLGARLDEADEEEEAVDTH